MTSRQSIDSSQTSGHNSIRLRFAAWRAAFSAAAALYSVSPVGVVRSLDSRSVVPRSRKTGETWGTPSVADSKNRTPFWMPRFYDFNVWTEKKRIEKLRYIHRNPVARGLVASLEQWPWTSFRWYSAGEIGPLKINDTDILVMTIHPPAA